MIKLIKINQDYLNMLNIVFLFIKLEYVDKIFYQKIKKVELCCVFFFLDKDDLVIVYVLFFKKVVVGYFKVKKIIKKNIFYFWDEVEEKVGIIQEEFYDYYLGLDLGIGIFF